jgi:thiol-disulfide isomerase/thioredoxin
VPGETVKVPKYFAETLGAVEMIYSCYAADESVFGPATDTVLRALAGNLEYLKPVVAEGDQNEEEEFNEELEPGLTFLDGANIIHHPHGAKHALDDLRALDLVGIYFSAHWCPPCRKFTPQLAEVYKEIAAAGKKFGVVFVSSDRDEESFREYFRKMPWVMIIGSAACISAADECYRLHWTMHRGICKKV